MRAFAAPSSLVLIALSACSTTEVEGPTADATAPPSTFGPGFVRVVSHDEAALIRATCMADLGFPFERLDDGSFSFGPYSADQDEAFLQVGAYCDQAYPLAEEFSADQDLTESEWSRIYEHQRDTWAPCMAELGVEVGTIPSRESFLANPYWIDLTGMSEQLDAAVDEGRLTSINDWTRVCPDRPVDLRP